MPPPGTSNDALGERRTSVERLRLRTEGLEAMAILAFGIRALTIALIAAILGGCGAQNVANVVPQSAMMESRHGKSWMLPEAKNEDLLYASDEGGNVYVYSYPALRLVGQLSGFDAVTQGLCVDREGNVFVPTAVSNTSGYVFEFSHGGSTPIATLDDPGWGAGCSIDPKTGNLAVTNIFSPNDEPYYHGDVAIYANAQGAATTYTCPYISFYDWAAYDNSGDLFVDGSGVDASGFPLAEMPAGSSTFNDITLNESIEPLSLQWNRGHLIIASGSRQSRDVIDIYRVAVSGGTGTIVGTTSLHTNVVGYDGNGQYWIQSDKIIGAGRKHSKLGLWRYPAGGGPLKIAGKFSPWGVVVSVAPSRK